MRPELEYECFEFVPTPEQVSEIETTLARLWELLETMEDLEISIDAGLLDIFALEQAEVASKLSDRLTDKPLARNLAERVRNAFLQKNQRRAAFWDTTTHVIMLRAEDLAYDEDEEPPFNTDSTEELWQKFCKAASPEAMRLFSEIIDRCYEEMQGNRFPPLPPPIQIRLSDFYEPPGTQ